MPHFCVIDFFQELFAITGTDLFKVFRVKYSEVIMFRNYQIWLALGSVVMNSHYY